MSQTGTTATATIPARVLVPVTELTPHPGNVRTDPNLTPGYVASLADGLLVPLRVTPRDEGGWTATADSGTQVTQFRRGASWRGATPAAVRIDGSLTLRIL
jgi:hypothetical protein